MSFIGRELEAAESIFRPIAAPALREVEKLHEEGMRRNKVSEEPVLLSCGSGSEWPWPWRAGSTTLLPPRLPASPGSPGVGEEVNRHGSILDTLVDGNVMATLDQQHLFLQK